jgi:hypothetical protein
MRGSIERWMEKPVAVRAHIQQRGNCLRELYVGGEKCAKAAGSVGESTRLYWAVEVLSVPVAASGTIGGLSFAAGGVEDASVVLAGGLSFAAADTMTMRVVVEVRPAVSVTT